MKFLITKLTDEEFFVEEPRDTHCRFRWFGKFDELTEIRDRLIENGFIVQELAPSSTQTHLLTTRYNLYYEATEMETIKLRLMFE